MLILVTGVPGSGKSLYSVDLIEKYIEANQILIKDGHEPREIYSDIDGLTIEGVKQSPDDWRDAPDGSIVVYDECQQKFGPDGQGRSGRADIQEFETHRHRGFDIILITQHPKLLHAHIRRLVGKHYHVERMYGTQNAKIYQRDGQIDIDKQAQLSKLDNFVWSYPKKHFGKYKSATLHTHKAHLPKFLKRAIIGITIIGILIYFISPYAMKFFTSSFAKVEETQTESSTKTVSNEIIITPAEETTPVACITMGDKCSCYNSYGYLLEIPYQYCKKFTEDTPRYLDLQNKQPKRAAAT